AGLRRALEGTTDELEQLHEGLRLIHERMERADDQDESMSSLWNEVRAVGRRLAAAGDALTHGLDAPPGSRTIRWMEARGRDKAVAVSSVPLDLAPILREDLFARAKTTIVTSATLATDPRFAFVTARLGLDTSALEPYTEIYPSPFAFARQALLVVPTDLAPPNVDPAGHATGVAAIALDLAAVADGGMFMLFTSHRDVQAMAARLRNQFVGRKRLLLVQGEEPRDALLTRFRESGRAILLGTASFWEGVDVPGTALHALLIAKLPFRVPTEPITAAHCEAIQAAGGDPFASYMLPHASLRLKQGFGRLIRSATDRGVVVVADSRLVAKRYGKGLLDALPPARRVTGAWQAVLPEIRSFYGR
ncbi:MAG TPA: helicase C-terminal domain-containing protein, partial [Gemmatimonadaceae bacterium]|nr:helicase C-terminal domain-containing protein [Gemmatimonadaceae bacterium]